MELKIYSQEGKETGKVRLKSDVWDEKVNSHVLHLALEQELANRRTGTHETKVRSEVSGSGKKPWKQKGTGRARSGSIRSPLWRHGGVVFGPHARSHGFSLNRQVRNLALRSALINLITDEKLIVLDSLESKSGKTKEIADAMKKLNAEKALILLHKVDKNLLRAGRNVRGVKFLPVSQLNVHDLLRFKKVFLTKETLTALEKVIS